MRKLFGFGTPKQLAATMERGGRALFRRFVTIFIQLAAVVPGIAINLAGAPPSAAEFCPKLATWSLREDRVNQQAASLQGVNSCNKIARVKVLSQGTGTGEASCHPPSSLSSSEPRLSSFAVSTFSFSLCPNQ